MVRHNSPFQSYSQCSRNCLFFIWPEWRSKLHPYQSKDHAGYSYHHGAEDINSEWNICESLNENKTLNNNSLSTMNLWKHFNKSILWRRWKWNPKPQRMNLASQTMCQKRRYELTVEIVEFLVNVNNTNLKAKSSIINTNFPNVVIWAVFEVVSVN